MNNLAVLLQAQGKLGEAEPLCKQVLRAQRGTLGEEHPDTLGSMNNLAELLRAQGKLGEAEPLYEQALRAQRDTLGENTLTRSRIYIYIYIEENIETTYMYICIYIKKK